MEIPSLGKGKNDHKYLCPEYLTLDFMSFFRKQSLYVA